MRNILISAFVLSLLISCTKSDRKTNHSTTKSIHIAFLHRSIGAIVYKGNTSTLLHKVFKKAQVSSWFSEYNKTNGADYKIESMYFPTKETYGDSNYPYDFWNIWVNHAGNIPYEGQPTLEILTQKYDVIIFKHCYPVGDILPNLGTPNASSKERRIENYQLQYNQLKEKLRSFPNTKFILWTGPASTKEVTTEEKARNNKEFVDWVKNTWDEPGDNIFLWDFYELETEGGLFLKETYATSPNNSHPNKEFAAKTAPLLCKRIVNVIEGRGDTTPQIGN